MAAIAAAPEAIESRKRGLRLADPIELVARSLRGLREMGQSPFEPPSVQGWPVNEQWLNLRWLQARRRTLAALLADEEVWASRLLPPELAAGLTPIAPLTLALPAEPSREALAALFADPVWQLA
jgi:hypothetical protein